MNTSQIESIRTQSEQAWEMAVETAGAGYPGGSDERAESMQSLADACDEAWQRAVDAVAADDLGTALVALEEARSIESKGGDDSHTRSAIEALTLPEDAVIVETMPDHLRDSHRAAGNWGTYPHNGAERQIMSRSDAEDLVDGDEYDHIVRDAELSDLADYPVA